MWGLRSARFVASRARVALLVLGPSCVASLGDTRRAKTENGHTGSNAQQRETRNAAKKRSNEAAKGRLEGRNKRGDTPPGRPQETAYLSADLGCVVGLRKEGGIGNTAGLGSGEDAELRRSGGCSWAEFRASLWGSV